MVPTPIRKAEPIVLFLRMQPHWMFIDELRRFVESFCAVACPGSDREWQLALAAQELMQNAIANGAGSDVELRLALDLADSQVRISVTNPTTPEAQAVLQERLDALYADPDPLRCYLGRMDTDPGERGGLGLARIRCEAELDLQVEGDGKRLTVHAYGALATPGQAARTQAAFVTRAAS